jgi:ELWxxDGT repeat protein
MKNLHFVFLNTFLFLSYSIYAQTFSSVDILAGTASSNPYCITSFNGKAYFDCLGDTAYGYELWMSDGTAAGTTMVKDVNPGSGDSYINYLTVVGNKLFFQANDGTHGQELWVSDGTTAGTMMVADIWAGQGSSYPDYMTAFNGKLYFSANDSIHGEELWVSDGTAAGTSMLMDIWPGIEGSQPKGYGIGPGAYYIDEFNSINGKLYFQANDSIHGGELWSTDGTTAGTAMVADIYPGIPDSNPFFMTSFNGKIYFSAAGDTLDGWELWTTDGTAAGTTMVKNIDPGTTSSTNNGYGADVADNSGFVPFNGKLYFSAYQPATGYELWATDGTAAGTTLVKDILAGPGSSYAGSYYALAAFNNKLYFAANDSVNGTQLWASDGTAAGTTLLNILSNYTPFASNPGYFINYNNSLVFAQIPAHRY